MDKLETILQDPYYKEYANLKNYILFREECYNSDGQLEKIKIYPELIEKYIKAYEFVSGIYIEPKYANYKKIISQQREKVTFITERPDGMKIQLFCHAKAMELLLTASDDNEDKSLYSISTILGEYNAPETYSVSYTALTKAGITIAQQGIKIPFIIKEKIIDHNYGIIGNKMFPKK